MRNQFPVCRLLHGFVWTLAFIGLSEGSGEVCVKDPSPVNALFLLQVRTSPETAGGGRSLSQVVAEEERQLDAMAAEMSNNDEGTAVSVSRLDPIDLQQASMQTMTGVYETKLDPKFVLDGVSESTVTSALAPISFSEYHKVPAKTVLVDAAPENSGNLCDPPCEHGHGLCHNGFCLCRSPYIGETCADVDLRASRHMAAVRSVNMLTSDPATTFLLLSEVPLLLAMLLVTLCVAAAVLLATFLAHVYFQINRKNQDAFEAEETVAEEDYHEAWLREKFKHKAASSK
eukprot:gnl/MRDRNA2_/MRDRNA2_87987_c0_seq1.p1 gnl/MRDRNA2_/MRDRNA2_87987_c0~~gnl/MRDRNA2_/MRDRNA2_87987_c0_seq1.p1  ORF type:complete len:287 (-),score=60.05 gnl/MRDRNA2_/MRDRNA2_87987_c0_seq1:58-918(-)